jgi:uncharacterized protein (UPF0261 family)
MGLPHIIAPCTINTGTPLSRNYREHPEYHQRKKYAYDDARTAIRLSRDELIMVADIVSAKLNNARGPVKVVIPLGGWSSIDKRGTDFYDAELDRVFVDEIKEQLRPDIEVREVNADLDTPEFAHAVVEAFYEVMAI